MYNIIVDEIFEILSFYSIFFGKRIFFLYVAGFEPAHLGNRPNIVSF